MTAVLNYSFKMKLEVKGRSKVRWALFSLDCSVFQTKPSGLEICACWVLFYCGGASGIVHVCYPSPEWKHHLQEHSTFFAVESKRAITHQGFHIHCPLFSLAIIFMKSYFIVIFSSASNFQYILHVCYHQFCYTELLWYNCVWSSSDNVFDHL